jgi:hypothetical protein
MATMGRRKIAKAKIARIQGASETNPLMIPIPGGLNVLIPETNVVIGVAWGFEQPPIGLPIMREGFITTTGLLQSST